MMNTLVILIVIIICVYTYVKTYQIVYIIYLQFIVCQLYSDKVIIKNKTPIPSGKKRHRILWESILSKGNPNLSTQNWSNDFKHL